MLIPSWAWRALLDVDVRLDALDDNRADLWVSTDDSAPFAVELKAYSPDSAPLRPATVRDLAERKRGQNEQLPIMFIVSGQLSPETIAELERHGWSWLALQPDGLAIGTIRHPGGSRLTIGQGPSASKKGTPGRVAYGAFKIFRTLLTNGRPRTQGEIAAVAGVSQPRVSQVIKQLGPATVGVFGSRYWRLIDWEGLCDRFLTTYPGPGGIATHWYGLAPIADQAASALAHVERSTLRGAETSWRSPVLSGDAAADLIAAWRRPRTAIIYANRSQGEGLQQAGLTPAGPEEATLTLVVPKDQSVWPAGDEPVGSPVTRSHTPLANGIQILWDVWRQESTDADQAAKRLRERLRQTFDEDFQKW